VYDLSETGHDPGNRMAAFEKALEWGDRIPVGVIYQTRLPTYDEQVAGLEQGPVATRELRTLSESEIERLRAEFM
jgi:2-oxoglutarate ferredoxin oxidoreductase subunit beta